MPTALQNISTWLFDLDNTLYSANSNLFPQIHERMGEYLMNYFKITRDAAHDLRFDYFKKYGTTMRGMMVEHKIDPHDFMEFVHNVPLDDIAPCPTLSALFEQLPGRKFIFTNADHRHANRILNHLQLRHHFEAIFDIADGDFICKPDTGPYETLLRRHNLNATECCMIDDMQVNLKAAADLGMTTVWMRHEAEWLRNKPLSAEHYPHCHHTINDLTLFLQHITGTKA
ncbi:MAG: pyrimidine 5'-nucleotidase [Alphaproteobacteria bacterium]|nr:pyrimidine 5'-nucleotidase [Alphaproteobacteria bacterium]